MKITVCVNRPLGTKYFFASAGRCSQKIRSSQSGQDAPGQKIECSVLRGRKKILGEKKAKKRKKLLIMILMLLPPRRERKKKQICHFASLNIF
jgi:hypothetical protein